MKITIKKDEEGHYIDMNDLRDFYDLEQIAYYTIETNNGNIELVMYDKDQNVIMPKIK